MDYEYLKGRIEGQLFAMENMQGGDKTMVQSVKADFSLLCDLVEENGKEAEAQEAGDEGGDGSPQRARSEGKARPVVDFELPDYTSCATLAEALKLLVEKSGWAPTKLQKAGKISSCTWNDIMAGRNAILRKTAARLQESFGMPERLITITTPGRNLPRRGKTKAFEAPDYIAKKLR